MLIFSFILGVGVALGLGWSLFGLPEQRAGRAVDTTLVLFLGSLLGSRLFYVAVHWAYFQKHLLEIPQVWLGGLSGVGGIWGAVITWWLIAGFSPGSRAPLADRLVRLGGMVGVSSWIACWFAGWAYGPVTAAWWGIPTRDEWGRYALRFPTQLLGACLALVLVWAIDVFQARRRKPAPGLAAAFWLIGMSLELLGLSFLRFDPLPLWHGLRVDTWGAISLIGGSLLFLWGVRRSHNSLFSR